MTLACHCMNKNVQTQMKKLIKNYHCYMKVKGPLSHCFHLMLCVIVIDRYTQKSCYEFQKS